MNKKRKVRMTKPRARRNAEYVEPLVTALREERARLLANASRLQGHILELDGGLAEDAFGRNVMAYRKLFGLTRLELAAQLGIGRSMVSQIEHGRYTTIERLFQLCEVFKVTPNDLLL